MEERPGSEKAFKEFEITYLERLRLAASVILEAAASDLEIVTDPLESELVIFKERVEFMLLLPEYANDVLPWRQMLDGKEPPSRNRETGNPDK